MPSQSITRTLRLFGRTVVQFTTEAEESDVELVELEDAAPRFGFAFPEEHDGEE